MPHAFAQIPFTPLVKAERQRVGNLTGNPRMALIAVDYVQRALDDRDARIADLESRLKAPLRQPQD